MKSKAIVLGLYGGNGLGVTRSLGRKKIPVLGFHKGKRFPHAYHSKHIEEGYLVENEDELIENLIEVGKKQKEKGVIFTTGDSYILFCQDYASELEKYYHVPLVKGKNLHDLLDKGNNIELGRDSGFNIPETQYLDEEITLKGKIIVKPLNGIGTGNSDILIFDNKNELEKEKEKLINVYENMVIMDYIEGGPKEHFETHVYNSSKGPIIGGMNKKLHALNNSIYGSLASIAQSVWVDELVEPSLKLAESSGFNGILDINLKQDMNSKKYYLMEVNYRTSAMLMLDTVSGLNLPAIVYYDHNGMDFSKLTKKEIRKDVKWLSEDFELANILDGSNKKLFGQDEYPKVMEGIEVCVYFDNTDLMPLLKAIEEEELVYVPSKSKLEL